MGELKQCAAFASVVTNDWDANSTWQLLSALTHNLARDFQVATKTASRRSNTQLSKSQIDTDLDWIVMKTLDKDRNRRYESAKSFG